ncbi:DUF2543 family protein [Providencia rettgeri]
MVEEYSLESAFPVTEEEFDPLAHYLIGSNGSTCNNAGCEQN